MKTCLLILLLPFLAQAGFKGPKLLARFMAYNAWNAPDNTWCFSGEPAAQKGKIYLNCLDESGQLMASWHQGEFKLEARASNGHLFSKPLNAFGRFYWYEFSEFSPVRSFSALKTVSSEAISNLGPLGSQPISHFSPITKTAFIFKNNWDDTQLWRWENNKVSPFFNPQGAYLFSLQTGPGGEMALKVRDNSQNENSPDRLWHYDGKEWRVILEDQDANPRSLWKSFRHQLSLEGKKVLVIANDGSKDVLLLIEGQRKMVIAQAGRELKSFDFFTPKLRAGIIVVRGEDFENRKVTYVKDEKSFRKLIAQGDLVIADQGPAQINYPSQHSIFYGAPGIDEQGNIFLQATLSDPNDEKMLLGIALLMFQKE